MIQMHYEVLKWSFKDFAHMRLFLVFMFYTSPQLSSCNCPVIFGAVSYVDLLGRGNKIPLFIYVSSSTVRGSVILIISVS